MLQLAQRQRIHLAYVQPQLLTSALQHPQPWHAVPRLLEAIKTTTLSLSLHNSARQSDSRHMQSTP